MIRGSDKHSPRVDDELRHEVDSHVRGSPAGSRAEEWHEPEPPAEGEPEASTTPEPDPYALSDGIIRLTPEEVEARSRFGRYLPRSVFPADRAALLRAAESSYAPDDVLEAVHRLPAGRTFPTAARAWAALGHRLDRRF
jgi:uncharacterized protein DUF2795